MPRWSEKDLQSWLAHDAVAAEKFKSAAQQQSPDLLELLKPPTKPAPTARPTHPRRRVQQVARLRRDHAVNGACGIVAGIATLLALPVFGLAALAVGAFTWLIMKGFGNQ